MGWANVGRVLAVCGMLAKATQCLSVRFLTESGATPWSIVMWLSLYMSLILGVFALVRTGGARGLLDGSLAGGGYFLLAVLMLAFMNVGFPLALCYTSAANMMLLTSLSPIWSALIDRGLGESLPRKTVVASVVACVAVAIICMPSLVHSQRTEALGSASLLGDVLSLADGLVDGALMNLVRYLNKRAPEADLTFGTSLGAGLAAVAALCVADGHVLPGGGFDWQLPSWLFWLVFSGYAASITFIIVVNLVSPLYMTASEVGFILLGSVIFGPLFVWAVYRDTPPVWTFVGGALLLATMFTHEALGMLESFQDSGEGKDAEAADGGTTEASEHTKLCSDPPPPYT